MIVLELFSKDKSLVDELINNHSEVQLLTSRKFQGEPETIQLLINLSPVIIPAVASVIKACIRSKKHVSLKYKGLEVKGISDSTVIDILTKLKDVDNTNE